MDRPDQLTPGDYDVLIRDVESGMALRFSPLGADFMIGSGLGYRIDDGAVIPETPVWTRTSHTPQVERPTRR